MYRAAGLYARACPPSTAIIASYAIFWSGKFGGASDGTSKKRAGSSAASPIVPDEFRGESDGTTKKCAGSSASPVVPDDEEIDIHITACDAL